MKNLSLLAVIFFFASCGTKETNIQNRHEKTVATNHQYESIFPSLDESLIIKPTVVSINAKEANEIEFNSGSKVSFDKNSFVDKDGKPVKGKIDIEWNEYHSLSDIMLSGIPMAYDSAGVENNLVSGGMFKINASQKGEEVFVAPGKEINVDIASRSNQSDFNFYQLDESNGSWNYKTTKSSEPFIEKDSVIVDDYTMLQVDVDTRQFPEVNEDELICWQTKQKLNIRQEANITKNKLSLMLDKKKDQFFIIDTVSEVEVEVDPKYFDDIQLDQKKIQEELENDRQMNYLSNISSFAPVAVRSIAIKGFGTYNWDCIHKWKEVSSSIAYYVYPNGFKDKTVSLFYISKKDNLVIPYRGKSGSQLKYDKTHNPMLLAILPDQSVVVAKTNQFFNVKKQKDGTYIQFNFKSTGIVLKDPNDINKYVDELFL